MNCPIEWEFLLEKDAAKRCNYPKAQKQQDTNKAASGITSAGTRYGVDAEKERAANEFLRKHKNDK